MVKHDVVDLTGSSSSPQVQKSGPTEKVASLGVEVNFDIFDMFESDRAGSEEKVVTAVLPELCLTLPTSLPKPNDPRKLRAASMKRKHNIDALNPKDVDNVARQRIKKGFQGNHAQPGFARQSQNRDRGRDSTTSLSGSPAGYCEKIGDRCVSNARAKDVGHSVAFQKKFTDKRSHNQNQQKLEAKIAGQDGQKKDQQYARNVEGPIRRREILATAEDGCALNPYNAKGTAAVSPLIREGKTAGHSYLYGSAGHDSRANSVAEVGRIPLHFNNTNRAAYLNGSSAVTQGRVDGQSIPPPSASRNMSDDRAMVNVDRESHGRISKGTNRMGHQGRKPFRSHGQAGHPRHQHERRGIGWNVNQHVAAEHTRLERELNIRKLEMESLSAAQAIKQRELDAQAVDLEVRERELEDRKRVITVTQSELETNTAAQKLEIEHLRLLSQREIERSTRELTVARSEFDHLVATKKRELEVIQFEQEREMEARIRSMQVQVRDIEERRNNLDREAEAQKRRLDTERLEHEIILQIRYNENQIRADMLAREQIDLEARVASQSEQKTRWNEMKARVKTAHAKKEEELEAKATILSKQNNDLRKFKNELEVAQARQQEELQGWAVSKATQQEEVEAWIEEVKSAQKKRLAELDARTAAQAKQQNELDVRAAAQRHRAKELKAAKRGIEDAQAKLKSSLTDKGLANEGIITEDAQMQPSMSKAEAKASPEGDFKSSKARANRMAVKGGENREVDITTEKQVRMPNADCSFVLIDSESDEDERNGNIRFSNLAQTNRDVRSPSAKLASASRRAAAGEQFRFNYQQNFNYNLSDETAQEIQERMLSEAAAKMRSQASARMAFCQTDRAFSLTTPIFDIAASFPDHWTWKDPYAVLGLPARSSISQVKSQYRRLARTYHPDKSSDTNTSAKFHSISSAYHNIAESF